MKPKTFDVWVVIFLCLLPNWKFEAEAKVRMSDVRAEINLY